MANAAASDIADLDKLGPVLCRLAGHRAALSVQGDVYYIEFRKPGGPLLMGYGPTAGAAYRHAMRHADELAAGGVYVDA